MGEAMRRDSHLFKKMQEEMVVELILLLNDSRFSSHSGFTQSNPTVQYRRKRKTSYTHFKTLLQAIL